MSAAIPRTTSTRIRRLNSHIPHMPEPIIPSKFIMIPSLEPDPPLHSKNEDASAERRAPQAQGIGDDADR